MALYMSSRDLARGLTRVCKAFRHLSGGAICLETHSCLVRFPSWQTASVPVRHAVCHALLMNMQRVL